MRNRLAICTQSLREIEAKLAEMNRVPSGDFIEDNRIASALSFIHQAMDAIAQTTEQLEILPQSKTELEPPLAHH